GRARVVASPCYAGRAADRPRGPPGWPQARVDLVVVIRPRSRALGANGGRSHPNRALHESAVQRCRGDPRGGDDHGIDLRHLRGRPAGQHRHRAPPGAGRFRALRLRGVDGGHPAGNRQQRPHFHLDPLRVRIARAQVARRGAAGARLALAAARRVHGWLLRRQVACMVLVALGFIVAARWLAPDGWEGPLAWFVLVALAAGLSKAVYIFDASIAKGYGRFDVEARATVAMSFLNL